MIPIPTNKKFSVLEILQYTVLISVLLYFGKPLFIPLSFALLISFILYPVCKWLEKKGISKSISIFISIFGILLFFGALLYLLFLQLIEFSNEWQLLKVKLLETGTQWSIYLSEQFNLSSENQSLFLKNAINNSGAQTILFIQNTLSSLSESVFYLLIIPIYSALILYYRQLLVDVLCHIFSSEKKETIREILIQTIHSYYDFIKGMLVVYLLVGLLNSIGLALIGVPHPFLFGFIASILTFIPYVGILISSLLPITISWITFNSIWYPIGVIAVFSLVQLIEAYIIFPLAVGKRLKINTLVIIVVIIIGGILWGAAGMILFIPFVSIAKLIAEKTNGLKTLAILLGEGESKKRD
ncbi:AI-2E family transporter [Flavobacterium alvei]|uniref:AI-2E family transporter n=1 Tax=Flavobacterium alvei TaxID=2080416 RepID=A0A2S5A5P0_9FLAO|nr:AI-2E family transporter [Flavobacterium alvei]POY37619.1 AI-2E family transporter [Flavobacterium alvei]